MKVFKVVFLFFVVFDGHASWGARFDELRLEKIQVELSGCHEKPSGNGVLLCTQAIYVGKKDLYLRMRTYVEGGGDLELTRLGKFNAEPNEMIYVAPSEYNVESIYFDSRHESVLETFDWGQSDWSPEEFQEKRIPFSTYSVDGTHMSVYMYYDLAEGMSTLGHVSAVAYVHKEAFRPGEGTNLVYSLSWLKGQSLKSKLYSNIEVINLVRQEQEGLTSAVAGVKVEQALGYVFIPNPLSALGAASSGALSMGVAGTARAGLVQTFKQSPKKAIKGLKNLLSGTGVAIKDDMAVRLAIGCLAVGGFAEYLWDSSVGTTFVIDGEGVALTKSPPIGAFHNEEVCNQVKGMDMSYAVDHQRHIRAGKFSNLSDPETYIEQIARKAPSELTTNEKKLLGDYFKEHCSPYTSLVPSDLCILIYMKLPDLYETHPNLFKGLDSKMLDAFKAKTVLYKPQLKKRGEDQKAKEKEDQQEALDRAERIARPEERRVGRRGPGAPKLRNIQNPFAGLPLIDLSDGQVWSRDD